MNVKDMNKLLKAVKNVSFGQFRVWAKIACFDRNNVGEDYMRQNRSARGEAKVNKNRVREEVKIAVGEGEKRKERNGEEVEGVKKKEWETKW